MTWNPNRALILQALIREPQHVDGAIAAIQERAEASGEKVKLGHGTTWREMQRLEEAGFVESYLVSAEGAGRPRRYYRLTALGATEAMKERQTAATLFGFPLPEGV